jgi:signal peptidase I
MQQERFQEARRKRIEQSVAYDENMGEGAALSGEKTKRKSVVREYAEAIVIALILALFIRTFVVQAFKIPSGSMKPTLLVGDHILVNKFIYGVKIPFTDYTLIEVSEPERGDVIVFKFPLDPSKDYIKRVIGLPGDRIQIINKHLLINGEPAPDPHAFYRTREVIPRGISNRDNFGPITVPADSLFVMGDNRDDSYDGRFWRDGSGGRVFVPLSSVKGEALFIYWSWDGRHFDVRWSRLGDLVR